MSDPDTDLGDVHPLLDVLAVARILGLSERHVWRKIRNGELGIVRIDGATRIHPEQVQAFIDAHRYDPDRTDG
jgi:excisionase family DNA binding protein